MQEQRKTILRMVAVCSATGLGRSSIYELDRLGHFPKRVALGVRSVGWYADEVADWIESRERKMPAVVDKHNNNS